MTVIDAALADEKPAGPAETRAELLRDVRRPATPVRHAFVQKPPLGGRATRGEQRGALLGELVNQHQERALDAYLWLLAIQPALGKEPLPANFWARALSKTDEPVPVESVTRVWRQLAGHNLIQRERRRRMTHVLPRREDGTRAYTRPGEGRESHGPGEWPREDYYLLLPHEYWLEGYHQRLSLTGKAMLLIALQCTGKSETFYLPYEMAPSWYGLSEETVQRGLQALRDEGLLDEWPQKKQSARARAGFTLRWHYSLREPFSTAHREQLSTTSSAEMRLKTPDSAAIGP